jgi:MFS family permease
VGCALAWNWYALLFFRWLGGVAVGGASVVCPMYITEIAPAKRRGLLVAVSQLNIVLGILAAYFSNYLVARVMGADHPDTWRWMFGVMTAPAIAFLLTALMIPEARAGWSNRGAANRLRRFWSALGTKARRRRRVRSRNR